MKYHSGFDY